MRFLSLIIMIVAGLASVADETKAEPPKEVTPLVRFYNQKTNEHFYSHSEVEMNAWRKSSHIKEHFPLGLVATKELPGTIPLYRAIRKWDGRHVYTIEDLAKSTSAKDYDIDEKNFKVFVWTKATDERNFAGAWQRVAVRATTGSDHTDIYFGTSLDQIAIFSNYSSQYLNIERLGYQMEQGYKRLPALFYIYPPTVAPTREQMDRAQSFYPVERPGSRTASPATPSSQPAETPRDGLVTFAPLAFNKQVTSFDMTDDGKFLVCTHQAANSVSIYDVLEAKVVAEIECTSPRSVLCRGNKAYVANYAEGTISVLVRANNWAVESKLLVPKLRVVHLAAAAGNQFADELIVTCYDGTRTQDVYHRSNVYRIDSKLNRAMELPKARVIFVSADGQLALSQEGYGVRAMNSRQYSQAAAQVDELFVGGTEPETYVYQVAPGSFWFGRDNILGLGSVPIQHLSVPRCRLIVPDKSQPLFYALDESQVRAHRLATTFPQIGEHPVQYPELYKNRDDIFQFIHRTRDYMFDHPIAFTHGDRLHMFVLTAKQGEILSAQMPALQVHTGGGYKSRAVESLAAIEAEAKLPKPAKTTPPPKITPDKFQLATGFPKSIPAGKEFRHKFQVSPTQKVELMSKLDGLKMDAAGQLHWQPASAQLGKQTLKMRLTSGDEIDIQRLEVEVVDGELLDSLGGDMSSFATFQRLDLETDDYYLTTSASGPRMLLVQGDELSILAGNGFERQRQFKLPKRYKMLQDRRDYVVAISQKNSSVLDIVDKSTMEIRKTIRLKREGATISGVSDWVLDPIRPVTYVAVRHENYLPRNSILQINETTGEITEMDIFGTWLTISPDGKRIFTGHNEIFRKGTSFHINPDWNILEIPKYGDIDLLMTWDTQGTGKLLQATVAPGASGSGIRLSPDGRRVTYLSFTGDLANRGDLTGWNTQDFKKDQVRYLTQGRGMTTELAYHPWLPLLATPGSDSAVFFNQDTGDVVENVLLLPSGAMSGEKVERIHFTPDGKHLLFVCNGSGGRYLRSVNLRLPDKELTLKRREPVIFPDVPPPLTSTKEKVNLAEISALKTPGKIATITPKEIGRKYLDACVTIKTNEGAGSGFFISESGYVLTSAHVVEDARKIMVIHNIAEAGKPFAPEEAKANIVAMDSELDIALLKIQTKHRLKVVSLASEEAVETGEDVIVIGNPGLGKEILSRTMTSGIVSNPERELDGQPYIQTSAAVNPGNSGGAMFDSRGLVIGMVNLKARIEGTAFAIPAKTLRQFMQDAASAKPMSGKKPKAKGQK